MNESSCIFCKIVSKAIPAEIIAENKDIIVIKDINPKAPVHYLIMPKIHIAGVSSLENNQADLIGNMMLMARDLSQGLPGNKAFRLGINNGADAGQIVFHLHIHFLAGVKLDA